MSDPSKNHQSIDTSGAHVDGGDVEALRAQFERRMNLRGWSEANIRRDGFDYSSTQLTEACRIAVARNPALGVTHKPNRKHGFDGTDPLGRLANAELRLEKRKAHAAFDPLWKSGQMTRRDAYAWLSEATGIDADRCHIGMMDVSDCHGSH